MLMGRVFFECFGGSLFTQSAVACLRVSVSFGTRVNEELEGVSIATNLEIDDKKVIIF